MNDIRNFCIIAHIDHGKSTLADCLLTLTETLSQHKMKAQVLDNMDLERERGITIKSHAIRISYTYTDGINYIFNLIDTPGHVDFSYEVSHALAACEGALLLIDASQGIQAQTISNLFKAREKGLKIIVVLNKIDISTVDVNTVSTEVAELIGVKKSHIITVSAKTGYGVPKVIDAIINQIPPPAQQKDKPLKVLIFDSLFDPYRGAIAYIRIMAGTLTKGDKVFFMANGTRCIAEEVGYLCMERRPALSLCTGEVGYMIGHIKSLDTVRVGDTITHVHQPTDNPIKGYQEAKPMVFGGIFPAQLEGFEALKLALNRLKLNDSALVYEAEISKALGFGFRVGFLGLLHMEIVQERLAREFTTEIINTMPNVVYKIVLKNMKKAEPALKISNPSQMPNMDKIDTISEPYIEAQIMTPINYIGAVIHLCQKRRGKYISQNHMNNQQVEIIYEIPLAEVVFDFYNVLKSYTSGYASMDYELIGFRAGPLARLDILLNGSVVDALSVITHRDNIHYTGRNLCTKLSKLIPRQQYEVTIQAAIGKKIISKESVRALRKDVTAKCYGGDITRKRKLLEKQKSGKKRMKQVGNIVIPQEAFLSVLTTDKK